MNIDRLHIDTNVLVRFFCGEPAPQAQKVRRLVERADAGRLILVVTPVIVAETFYTLESFYEMDRKDVAEKLGTFLGCRGIEVMERDVTLRALALCANQNVHFADAYLACFALDTNEPVGSFDRGFDKIKGVQRVEPG